jgi:hypothetical protein
MSRGRVMATRPHRESSLQPSCHTAHVSSCPNGRRREADLSRRYLYDRTMTPPGGWWCAAEQLRVAWSRTRPPYHVRFWLTRPGDSANLAAAAPRRSMRAPTPAPLALGTVRPPGRPALRPSQQRIRIQARGHAGRFGLAVRGRFASRSRDAARAPCNDWPNGTLLARARMPIGTSWPRVAGKVPGPVLQGEGRGGAFAARP